jgi:transcriptional regulator with XRE-family HTH domain
MDLNPTDLGVGARVRSRRIALGVSPEKLACELGVSSQQIIAWEAGVTRIGASWLSKVAEVLNVSPLHFFKDFDPRRLH